VQKIDHDIVFSKNENGDVNIEPWSYFAKSLSAVIKGQN
jgi:hypothetical protein